MIDLREFIIAQYANIYNYDSMELCFEVCLGSARVRYEARN